MNRQMCVYRISEAPYVAVNALCKVKNNKYFVETTNGKLKEVTPIYTGPFDLQKFLNFGSLVSKYISDIQDLTDDFSAKSLDVFHPCLT